MTSISAERSALARVGGGLIRREQWGARRSYTDARAVVEPARQVFIHVSVTNPSAYNSHAAHVRAIEAIGRSRFSNTGISYNRIILFGVETAYEAQPMGRRGAHTVNDFGYGTCQRWGSQCPGRGGSFNTAGHGNNLNYSARAYCYGALCEATATDSVVDTFARTIAADMKAGLVRRDAEIHGHRCVSAKSCPCGMWARMHDLRRRIDHYLGSDLEDDMPLNADDLQKIAAVLRQHDGNPVGEYNGRPLSRDEAMFRGAQFAGGSLNLLKYTVTRELAEIRAAAGGHPVDEEALAQRLASLLLPEVGEQIRAELAEVDGVDEDAVTTKIVARVGAKLSAPDA